MSAAHPPGNRTLARARRELWLGLRFATGLCLAPVALALAPRSAAPVRGRLLLAACATVTATNLCIPSELIARWQRRVTRNQLPATEEQDAQR